MKRDNKKITYRSTGVDYDSMDPFKIMAQIAGQKTAKNISRFGFSEYKPSRGESAYLIETPDAFLTHVEEGLGTKNLVADAMYHLTGKSYYDHIAQDTVAMIVNDMVTLGALPLSVAMHLAVGNSDWFKDEIRCQDLICGWRKACDLSRASWGGGETPTLKDIINPETIVLSGSAIGIIKPKKRLLSGSKIQDKDAIILIESSGIHANGLTLARKIADRLPQGYLTKLSDGRTYGESLLDPTIIYVPLIEDCLNQGIDIHYAINITGHGWRKLMRAKESFTYIIDTIPEPQPVFKFIQEQGPVDNEEIYGNLNMGVGFAFYVPEKDVNRIISVAKDLKMIAFQSGYIEQSKEKKVIIKPKNLQYKSSTLGVR